MYRWILVAVTSLLVAPSWAGENSEEDKKKSEEGLPLEAERTIEFDTDEGTWISLDLSPDGQTIIFELLGDIFTVPVTGGDASVLLTGMAFESQPAYSPNGRQIAFIPTAMVPRTSGLPMRMAVSREN